MMAQHILTRPVFEALFEHYDFAAGNPVARALDTLRQDFGEFGLENETRDLEHFYESVRMRARGLDNSEARQHVLMELYEKFFTTALKKDADRLGIVYTPVEIVDFILNSADHVVRREFGRSLSDEGVHVLDPFTGTGIFLVRLIQSALVRESDLARKYHGEFHANEIVLLAYYIAAIHIEEAFHGRRGAESAYEPFEGIVLTDTFNLHTDRTGFPKNWLPVNSARAERQQDLPIQVIVGNPPWSAKQRSSADDNPTVTYPELERRVAKTYAARSRSTNKNSLYDTLQDGDPLGSGPDRRTGRNRACHQRLLDRRQRGLRRSRLPGGGIQLGLCSEPAGQSADAGRTLAPGRGQSIRTGLPGTGCDYDLGPQSGDCSRRLPHPLPRYR